MAKVKCNNVRVNQNNVEMFKIQKRKQYGLTELFKPMVKLHNDTQSGL